MTAAPTVVTGGLGWPEAPDEGTADVATTESDVGGLGWPALPAATTSEERS